MEFDFLGGGVVVSAEMSELVTLVVIETAATVDDAVATPVAALHPATNSSSKTSMTSGVTSHS